MRATPGPRRRGRSFPARGAAESRAGWGTWEDGGFPAAKGEEEEDGAEAAPSGTHGAGRLEDSAGLRRRGSVARRASPALRGGAAAGLWRRWGEEGGCRGKQSPASTQEGGERAAGSRAAGGRQNQGAEVEPRGVSTGRADEARAGLVGGELRAEEGAGEQH